MRDPADQQFAGIHEGGQKGPERREGIVGGSSGTGLATAHAAAAAGAAVTIASSDQGRLDTALAGLPGTCDGAVADIRREADVAALFAQIGELDHLVYTAGDGLAERPMKDLSLDEARQLLEVRFWGAIAAVKHGLAALRGTGHLATPDVLAVTDRLLLLEALVPRDDSAGSWEAFARDMAGAHRAVASARFGWPADGWLGRLRQVNTWNADGHEFFAEHRLLRYLTEPPAEQALTADDRRAVERLCARLPELIPPMPAVLTHGDLWTGNLVSQPGGRITVIDPAVSYTWAEVDLSMLWGNATAARF